MRNIITLIHFCFLGISLSAQTGSRPYTNPEKKAIDVVSALPEVKKLFQIYADSPAHFEIIIAREPNLKLKYYWIKVGQRFSESGEDAYDYFLAHYDFYVTPNTYEIKNLDVVTNTPISLKKWRSRINKSKS